MITANPNELFDGRIERAADEDLIDLLRRGSNEALTVLFDRYHRLVFHVALRIVRDPGEAEEVVTAASQFARDGFIECCPEFGSSNRSELKP